MVQERREPRFLVLLTSSSAAPTSSLATVLSAGALVSCTTNSSGSSTSRPGVVTRASPGVVGVAGCCDGYAAARLGGEQSARQRLAHERFDDVDRSAARAGDLLDCCPRWRRQPHRMRASSLTADPRLRSSAPDRRRGGPVPGAARGAHAPDRRTALDMSILVGTRCRAVPLWPRRACASRLCRRARTSRADLRPRCLRTRKGHHSRQRDLSDENRVSLTHGP